MLHGMFYHDNCYMECFTYPMTLVQKKRGTTRYHTQPQPQPQPQQVSSDRTRVSSDRTTLPDFIYLVRWSQVDGHTWHMRLAIASSHMAMSAEP